MTPLKRQYALKKRGITQTKIAEDLKVSDMSVSDVIHGRMVSSRIMQAIAEAIGEDVRIVFSEYYLKPPRRKSSKVARVA